MKTYRLIAALVVWAGLLLQYFLMVRGQSGEVFATRTVNFFSYFTILSNLLAAAALTAPTVAPASALGRFFSKPSVRTAVVLYTSVTAAIYIAILQNIWNPQGLQWLADTALHYVTPGVYLIDWLLFTPKGALRLRSVLLWLIFPLGYGLYSILRGPLSGFYPYPFLDVSDLGLAKVAVNMAAVAGLFLALGLAFVLIDRLLKRRRA